MMVRTECATGLWLQRVSLPFAPDMDFDEPLCRLVRGEKETIWNNEWVSSGDLKKVLDATKIVSTEKLKDLEPVVPKAEVALFVTTAEYAS